LLLLLLLVSIALEVWNLELGKEGLSAAAARSCKVVSRLVIVAAHT